MSRIWEIDFLRGIGVFLMLFSNLITDLQYFLNFPRTLFSQLLAYITASIFVFVSGLCFNISYSRRRSLRRILMRFLKLTLLGFSVTTATLLFLKRGTIYFGILHFLGLASILAIPFYKIGRHIPIFIPLFIICSLFVEEVHADTLMLLPLGITPYRFFTLDYFPIFPWFGVYLLGLWFGFVWRRWSEFPELRFLGKICKIVCIAGRNSLKIYFIHQPIFLFVLLLIYGNLPNLNYFFY